MFDLNEHFDKIENHKDSKLIKKNGNIMMHTKFSSSGFRIMIATKNEYFYQVTLRGEVLEGSDIFIYCESAMDENRLIPRNFTLTKEPKELLLFFQANSSLTRFGLLSVDKTKTVVKLHTCNVSEATNLNNSKKSLFLKKKPSENIIEDNHGNNQSDGGFDDDQQDIEETDLDEETLEEEDLEEETEIPTGKFVLPDDLDENELEDNQSVNEDLNYSSIDDYTEDNNNSDNELEDNDEILSSDNDGLENGLNHEHMVADEIDADENDLYHPDNHIEEENELELETFSDNFYTVGNKLLEECNLKVILNKYKEIKSK